MTDKRIYAMSKVGSCSRTLSAEKLGLLGDGTSDTPEYLRLAAREGNRHEVFIREDIEEFGWKSTTKDNPISCNKCEREGAHVEVDTGNQLLVGHIDDICYMTDDPNMQMYLAEYKALGRFTFAKLEKDGIDKHRTHATQITCYQKAMGMPIFYVRKNRDTGGMALTIMEEPPMNFDSVVARLDLLDEYLDKGELAPCDMPEGSIDKWSCSHLCDKESAILPESLITDNALFALQEVKRAKDMQKEGKAIEDEHKSFLTAFLNAHGNKSIKAQGVRVTYVPEGVTKKYNVPDEIKKEYLSEGKRQAYIRIENMD